MTPAGIDGKYFENIVRNFMSSNEPASDTSPTTIEGQPGGTRLDHDLFRVCPRCHADPSLEPYHFFNRRTGQRLTLEFHYKLSRAFCEFLVFGDPEIGMDIADSRHRRWTKTIQKVDSEICLPLVPPQRFRAFTLPSELLGDVLAFLSRKEVDKCQLVSRRFDDLIIQQSAALPLHFLHIVVIRPLSDSLYTALLVRLPSDMAQPGRTIPGNDIEFLEVDIDLSHQESARRMTSLFRNCVIRQLRLAGRMGPLMTNSLVEQVKTSVRMLSVLPTGAMQEARGQPEDDSEQLLQLMRAATEKWSTERLVVGGLNSTRYALESPLIDRFRIVHVPVYFVVEHRQLLLDLLFGGANLKVLLDFYTEPCPTTHSPDPGPGVVDHLNECTSLITAIFERLRAGVRPESFVQLLRLDLNHCDYNGMARLSRPIGVNTGHWQSGREIGLASTPRHPPGRKIYAYAVGNATAQFTALLMIHPRYVDLVPSRLVPAADGVIYSNDDTLTSFACELSVDHTNCPACFPQF